MRGSFNDDASFVFEDVALDETIGNFGLAQGTAAGDEIDRCDFALGTPASALRLATAHVAGPYQSLAVEEQTPSAARRDKLRADMVLIKSPTGGAVFSVGSMTWCGSLSHNRYRNSVSRITENVLVRFLGDVI